MKVDQASLAAKLKEARALANLTQEQVAESLDLPRTAVVQIEAGNRTVSTLELAQLAQLYGRTIASFFEMAPTHVEDDVLVTLFRTAQTSDEQSKWKTEVARCLSLCRAGVELEQLLERPPHLGPPSYDLPTPRNTMDALDQGNFVAEQERLRLALGHNALPDMAELINGQNIWASGANLPDNMSGLFLQHDSIGLFILVNCKHTRARKRFSYAHEYAHALLDRRQTAAVSIESHRRKLTEVRANAFAASFLLPRTGVWAFLHSRFKGGPSVVEQTVYDPAAESTADEVTASRRTASKSQALTYEDVAVLAHQFGVSYQAALFRLKDQRVVHTPEFNVLRAKEDYGKRYLQVMRRLEDLEGRDQGTPDRELVSQILHLAIEAFRREEITKAKLRDLSLLLSVPAKDLLALAEAA